ncbi:MAG: hypothetical protein PF445_02595, partial [Melioribacteraceae bacterium]|nr:hypothetical protein [Melioribacteraceae bacterium]
VEDSELEKLAEEEASKTGISVKKLVKYYKDTNRKESLLEDKVIKFLTENTKVKEIDADKAKKDSEKKPAKKTAKNTTEKAPKITTKNDKKED